MSSNIASTMKGDVLLRYNKKIMDFCHGIDPFSLKKENDPLPRNIGYFDIVNYCINKDSSYTNESFKAYKALDAYKYYENGWVQSMACKRIQNGFILLATVKHSFKLNLKPVSSWVSVDENGIVLTAHCECIAGHGEESISCTDVLAKWIVPKMKVVDMASIDNIDFGHVRQEASLDEGEAVTIDTSMNLSILFPDQGHEEDDPSTETVPLQDMDEEINVFLKKIRENGVSCPMMAIREPFSSTFVPKKQEEAIHDLTEASAKEEFHVIQLFLSSLFNPAYNSLSLDELRDIADGITLTYTQEQIDFINHNTREQSSCKLWYRFRTGRVTGSTFKSVCRTSIEVPAISIVEKICFPERHIFKSKQTEYGKRNESIAKNAFFDAMSSTHKNYQMENTGLVINSEYPFCGVSPNAVVQCDCCGKGVVEIKCPFLMRFGEMNTYLKKKDCAVVIVVENGDSWTYNLKAGHEYYYQVQLQIFLLEVDIVILWFGTQKTF